MRNWARGLERSWGRKGQSQWGYSPGEAAEQQQELRLGEWPQEHMVQPLRPGPGVLQEKSSLLVRDKSFLFLKDTGSVWQNHSNFVYAKEYINLIVKSVQSNPQIFAKYFQVSKWKWSRPGGVASWHTACLACWRPGVQLCLKQEKKNNKSLTEETKHRRVVED